MTNLEPLSPGEVLVDEDGNELLFRQMTSSMLEGKTPSSLAFAPQASDHRKPSFARGSKTTAQASRDWHTSNARQPSMGVWACSVGEVQEIESRAIDDCEVPRPPDEKVSPGHCYVDYRNLSKNEKRILQGFLLAKALDRQEIPTTSSVG